VFAGKPPVWPGWVTPPLPEHGNGSPPLFRHHRIHQCSVVPLWRKENREARRRPERERDSGAAAAAGTLVGSRHHHRLHVFLPHIITSDLYMEPPDSITIDEGGENPKMVGTLAADLRPLEPDSNSGVEERFVQLVETFQEV
jgi:hypothetical protein